MVRLSALSFLFILATLFRVAPAESLEIWGLESIYRAPEPGGEDSFIAPNERDPQIGLEIFNEAGPGVYLSVGTERGFLSSALAERATSLLLVDIDPRVVFYNNVNIALLKLAKDREDYLALRLTASSQTWAERALQSPRAALSHVERELLQDSESWAWWTSQVRENPRFGPFHQPGHGPNTFENVNYLFSDALFERVQSLSVAGKIQSFRIDLSDAVVTSRLFRDLERTGESISVLDISNAWTPRFMTPHLTLQLLMQARAVMSEDSLLLYTYQYFDAQKKGTPYFVYGAATGDRLYESSELAILMTHWEVLARSTDVKIGFNELNGHRNFIDIYQSEQSHHIRNWLDLINGLSKAFAVHRSQYVQSQSTASKSNIFSRIRKALQGQPAPKTCSRVF